MEASISRKERLEQLLDLARTYRRWTRKELARALGRDPTKLVPASGIPKLDLVVDLAGVLDWPVDVVVEFLWTDETPAVEPGATGNFESLDEAAKAAHREGSYQEMIKLAQEAYESATTPEQRAIACNREAGGWDGLGRYTSVLEALQRGLREAGLTADRRLMLRVNMANSYYTLWHLFEAKATAHELVQWYEVNPPPNRLNRVVQAFAYYVRGNSCRRLMDVEPEHASQFAADARADLTRSRDLYLELAEEFDDESYRGVANTCEGGIIEVRVVLGELKPSEALERYTECLEELVDPEQYPVGDWLESYGWWCIFGCNVALRHLTDDPQLQKHMAVYTNKADEIAERLDNWVMRERVFTLEYARRQRFLDWTGVEQDWMIDVDDVRVITGTMGRFPSFHRTGWRILQTAKVVRDN
jgi:tetratricopeptide (TPR) repeat protein